MQDAERVVGEVYAVLAQREVLVADLSEEIRPEARLAVLVQLRLKRQRLLVRCLLELLGVLQSLHVLAAVAAALLAALAAVLEALAILFSAARLLAVAAHVGVGNLA